MANPREVFTGDVTAQKEHYVGIRIAELQRWQKRAEKKLSAYALSAEESKDDPDSKLNRVYEDQIEKVSAKIKVVKVERQVAANQEYPVPSWLQRRLGDVRQDANTIDSVIEGRKRIPSYQQAYDDLNDLTLAIRYAHKETLRLQNPNLDEASLDFEGDSQVLGSLRGAQRDAQFAVVHSPQGSEPRHG